ncbi:MAG: carbon-nitrogen hydrolase [Verrucomicrobia bacterium]|nr:carbon-nitrogen hydrolase [Verrucomicrobiota bacterium]MBV9659515.1 carbon-nitrogen hydrolase [Verrucomicrobiota bacterium]
MTADIQSQNAITRLALVQMACAPEPDVNRRRAVEKIRAAAAQCANVVCLPELFASQYFCQSEDHAFFALAETIPGPSSELFSALAAELRIVIVASLFERRAAGLYHNTAIVLDADGKLLGRYRKMHIPDDPGFYEKFYFTPGDLGFRSFATQRGQLGVCVCWDQWFPEAARLTALSGAQLLFYPTAIGWHPGEKAEFGERQHASWETIQRGHAIANGCFVAAVNRVGHEAPAGGPGIEFWGQSFLCDPSGQIVAKASVADEETLIAEVDFGAVETQRTHWPFLRDRRIEAYADLGKRLID